MTSTTRYPQELRERAVRLVLGHVREYPSEWAAIKVPGGWSRSGGIRGPRHEASQRPGGKWPAPVAAVYGDQEGEVKVVLRLKRPAGA